MINGRAQRGQEPGFAEIAERNKAVEIDGYEARRRFFPSNNCLLEQLIVLGKSN